MAEKKSSSSVSKKPDDVAEPLLPEGTDPEMIENSKRSLGAINTEEPVVEERTLTSTTVEETEKTGTVLEGAADKWYCIAKAYNTDEGWMRSTKAMQVGASGCLVQTSYIWTNPDGSLGSVESVCFAERVTLQVTDGKASFLQ